MKFPWKSKKDEEEIDDSEKEQIVTEISQPSPQYNHSSASENRVDRLEIDIERVKALLSTFSEYRKVNDERLTRINESMGGLRTSIIEREKQIKDLEIAALKSSDLVKEVQPEKLLSEVKKTEGKTEILQGKLESYDSLISNIIEEIKTIRRTTLEFEALGNIEEARKELSSELAEIKKREISIEIESSKVTKIFQEIQKRYEHQQELNSLVNQSIETDNELKKQINGINIKLSTLLDKEELTKLKSEIKELLSETGFKPAGFLTKTFNKARSINPPIPINKNESHNFSQQETETISQSEISRFQYDNIKSSLRELEENLLSKVNEESIKTKSYLKEFELSLNSFKNKPENPIYRKLRDDIYVKLSHYDNFLSDIAIKVPQLENAQNELKQHLTSILMKNQEIINYIKNREILETSSKEFVKQGSLENVKKDMSILNLKLNELNENIKALSSESNKKYHEIIYTINEKADKSLLEDSFNSSLYETGKRINQLRKLVDDLPISNSDEIKARLVEIDKKLTDIRYRLNEKTDLLKFEELKEKLESKSREQESLVLFLQEGVTALLDLVTKKEIPEMKNHIVKMNSIINDIIRRDEQWMASVFKVIEK